MCCHSGSMRHNTKPRKDHHSAKDLRVASFKGFGPVIRLAYLQKIENAVSLSCFENVHSHLLSVRDRGVPSNTPLVWSGFLDWRWVSETWNVFPSVRVHEMVTLGRTFGISSTAVDIILCPISSSSQIDSRCTENVQLCALFSLPSTFFYLMCQVLGSLLKRFGFAFWRPWRLEHNKSDNPKSKPPVEFS